MSNRQFSTNQRHQQQEVVDMWVVLSKEKLYRISTTLFGHQISTPLVRAAAFQYGCRRVRQKMEHGYIQYSGGVKLGNHWNGNVTPLWKQCRKLPRILEVLVAENNNTM